MLYKIKTRVRIVWTHPDYKEFVGVETFITGYSDLSDCDYTVDYPDDKDGNQVTIHCNHSQLEPILYDGYKVKEWDDIWQPEREHENNI
jgi:hypothetical protein